jgi:hypothetical protein
MAAARKPAGRGAKPRRKAAAAKDLRPAGAGTAAVMQRLKAMLESGK